MKRVLIMSRKSPYGSQAAREAIELAMAYALFDQKVSMLLLNDGVFQLLPGQQSAALGQKNIESLYHSLGLYGIEQIYVAERDLSERGLHTGQLSVPVNSLDDAALNELIHQQDQVINV